MPCLDGAALVAKKNCECGVFWHWWKKDLKGGQVHTCVAGTNESVHMHLDARSPLHQESLDSMKYSTRYGAKKPLGTLLRQPVFSIHVRKAARCEWDALCLSVVLCCSM